MSRQSIFISHATPEDNGFVRWLGARLQLAGYSVWHDLSRLKGGDQFWDKIEGAIRNESFRFLAVVSTVAIDKQGVKDEWAVAQTVEKSLPGFVIPLRLDKYDFSLLPIGIHRKQAWPHCSTPSPTPIRPRSRPPIRAPPDTGSPR